MTQKNKNKNTVNLEKTSKAFLSQAAKLGKRYAPTVKKGIIAMTKKGVELMETYVPKIESFITKYSRIYVHKFKESAGAFTQKYKPKIKKKTHAIAKKTTDIAHKLKKKAHK